MDLVIETPYCVSSKGPRMGMSRCAWQGWEGLVAGAVVERAELILSTPSKRRTSSEDLKKSGDLWPQGSLLEESVLFYSSHIRRTCPQAARL